MIVSYCEQLRIGGRTAIVKATVSDYLEPHELAKILNKAIRLDRLGRNRFLRERGIRDLEIDFLPDEDC